MKITIIAVGKVKEKFYRDALAEYGKRLGKYCRLEVVEVEDEKTPDKAGEALELQIKEKEAQRILKYVKEDAYLITLEIEGRKMDSVSFAKKLEKLATYGTSHIQFVIDCMHQNTTKIRNIKKYLLAVLFNAPNTIDSYYTALVAHDMASGVFLSQDREDDTL